MRTHFSDETRILKRVNALPHEGVGHLRLWHFDRHKPYQGVAFDDRTLGDLLEEFYIVALIEAEELRRQRHNLKGALQERLYALEKILDVGDKNNDEWETAHSTGDPLVDYWEYRATRDLPVDLDLEEAPPRERWDDP